MKILGDVPKMFYSVQCTDEIKTVVGMVTSSMKKFGSVSIVGVELSKK